MPPIFRPSLLTCRSRTRGGSAHAASKVSEFDLFGARFATLWAQFRPMWVNLGLILTNLADCVRSRSNIGRSCTDLDRFAPKSVECGQVWPKLRQHPADVRQIWPNFDKIRLKLGKSVRNWIQHSPDLAHICLNLAKCSRQVWEKVDQTSPSSAQVGPHAAEDDRSPSWTKSAEGWPTLVRFRQNVADLGRIRANSGQTMSRLGRTLAQFVLNLAQIGRTRTHPETLGPGARERRRSSARAARWRHANGM